MRTTKLTFLCYREEFLNAKDKQSIPHLAIRRNINSSVI